MTPGMPTGHPRLHFPRLRMRTRSPMRLPLFRRFPLSEWRGQSLLPLNLLASALLLPACGTVRYYGQAVRGQWQLQRAAQPLDRVMADPQTSPALKAKLAVVQDIRRFAAETLALPAARQYTAYADVQRPYAVWVVFAAPEFSVEPHRWWYPLVGSLTYRGFFREAPARALAAQLEAQGLDTYVGGVAAYSTLGWLKDPVLNTFVHREDADLAELIFHELTHQKLYLSGDTDFNEALATTYAHYGVRRWLEARGRASEWQTFAAQAEGERAFIALALATREELRRLYAATQQEPAEIRRARKAEVLQRFRDQSLALRRQYPALRRIDRWFSQPVNNARLNTLATYYRLVPGFEALLRQHPDDAEAFFRTAQALGQLPRPQRHATLLAWGTASSSPRATP